MEFVETTPNGIETFRHVPAAKARRMTTNRDVRKQVKIADQSIVLCSQPINRVRLGSDTGLVPNAQQNVALQS